MGVPHLVQVQKKYKDKGVVLLALSDEPAGNVARFVQTMKADYIVGSQAGETRGAYAVRSYPTIFLIDAKGKVVYTGHDARAAEGMIETLLKKTPPKMQKSIETRWAEERIVKADVLYKEGKSAEALKELEQIIADYPGSPAVERAKGHTNAMKAGAKALAELRNVEARQSCEDWLRDARAMAKDGKRPEAKKLYERIIQEFPDTDYAQTAKRELASIPG